MHRVFHCLLATLLATSMVASVSYAKGQKTWLTQVTDSLNQELGHQLEQVAKNMSLDYFKTQLSVSYLDPRLNLKLCGHPPKVAHAVPVKLGRVHIKVSCSAPSPWAINVPVTLKLFTHVVVLSRPIGRNTVLKADDVDDKILDIGSLTNGYFLKNEDVIGKQSKRSLGAQTVVTPHLLLPALMIKKGDYVIIKAEKPGMSVKMTGEALNDGREGRQIRVQNSRSQRIVKARVVAPGVVRVDF